MKDYPPPDAIAVAARPLPEVLAMIFEELVRTKTGLDTVKTTLDGVKTSVRAISPRLDTLASGDVALSARIDTLSVEFRTLQEKVHRANNLLTPFANELQELHQARLHFERCLDLLEARVSLMRHQMLTGAAPGSAGPAQ